MLKYMGMSIHDNGKNSNVFLMKIPNGAVVAMLFISTALLSFAIGRISAFSEFDSGQQDIIITNTEIYDSN